MAFLHSPNLHSTLYVRFHPRHQRQDGEPNQRWVLPSWNLWSKRDRLIDQNKCKIIWPDGFLLEILIFPPSLAFPLTLLDSGTQNIHCCRAGMTQWKSEVSLCLLGVKK